MSQSYTIYFHDDVDGIVSAALILKHVVKGNPYLLQPVKSSQRGDKFDHIIKNRSYKREPCIIVDYQHHELADLWIDHHYNKAFGDDPVNTKDMAYNPKAKSAARVIRDMVKKSQLGQFTEIDESIINMTDMIDSAGYESIEFIFSSKHPLMMLKAYLEQMSIQLSWSYCRAVEAIVVSDFKLEDAMLMLGITPETVESLRNSAKNIGKAMVVNGGVAITEMKRLYAYPRYSEYFVRPDMKYSFRIIHLGGDRIQTDVGFNQWGNFTNEINIGQMLGGFDYTISGGGHHDVGGSIITADKLEQHIDDITSALNPEDPVVEEEMEKVGVDKKADSVEKKAGEMVKTGEVDNLNKAREKAAKEEEDGTENVQGTSD